LKKNHKKEVTQAVLRREDMGSTAIGGYIALPHARINCVKNVMVTIGISKEGIEFESLDGEPVNVIILLLSNKKEAGGHLKTLAALAKILKDKSFIQYLKESKTEKEVVRLFSKQQSIL
jgi:mannitol/fructose-specific phosphotransferase system IIA component (Ntr-type)